MNLALLSQCLNYHQKKSWDQWRGRRDWAVRTASQGIILSWWGWAKSWGSTPDNSNTVLSPPMSSRNRAQIEEPLRLSEYPLGRWVTRMVWEPQRRASFHRSPSVSEIPRCVFYDHSVRRAGRAGEQGLKGCPTTMTDCSAVSTDHHRLIRPRRP